MESRAGRVAALAAVLIGVFSWPLVLRNLGRIVSGPGYDDSRLFTIDRETIHHNSAYGAVSPFVLAAWRRANHSFVDIFPLDRWTSQEGLHTERVSPGLLENTGVHAWRGRLLSGEDAREAVVSFEFARGDAGMIGHTVRLNLQDFQIVGIMPPRYSLVSRVSELWIPLPRGAQHLEFVARLRPAVTAAQAQYDLRAISKKARHWGTGKLEVVSLRQNRQDDFWFPFSVLKWNIAFVVALAIRGWFKFLGPERRRIYKGQQLRYLAFLVFKTAVLLLPLTLVWILFVDPEVQQYLTGLAGWGVPVFFWIYLLTAWGLTIWSLHDQQNRCRTCLQHLKMPLNRGTWSSLVLDRPATESICVFGHGTLYVPGTRLLNLDSVNWTPREDMWRELTAS
ncbi:MAG: ABC transporter permease [Acidobacteriota bacterium]|nr:ABC transporter permease [Acidobacteriota bacterium]